MPRNPERDRLQREERRQQIISAALQMFTQRGVAACKISDIASHAGLSHGHVYNFFASKEELLETIVQQSQEEYGRSLIETIAMPISALDKIKRISEQFLSASHSSKAYWVVLQAQATNVLSEAVKSQIRERMFVNLARFTEIIEEGQRDKTIMEGDPKQLAMYCTNYLSSLGLWDIRGFEPSDIDSTWNYLLKMLRP
jgi:AcrR family transcriptional regulator